MGRGPQVLVYHGDRICKSGLDFAILYGLTDRQRWRCLLLEQTRNEVIVFAQGHYGIFHI